MVHGLETMKKLNDDAVALAKLANAIKQKCDEIDKIMPPVEYEKHSPLSELKEAIQKDEDYAWTWFCNLACIGIDSGGDYAAADRQAAQFMKNAFEVEMRAHENWASRVDDSGLAWSAMCDTLLTKLQSLISSDRKRTHEQMQDLADRLVAMGATVSTTVLTNGE